MQVLVWNWWNAHGLLRKRGKKNTFTQNIMTYRVEVPWCKASQQELLSFALRASEQNPKHRGCHRHDVVQVSAGILEVCHSQIPHLPR